MTSSSIGSTYWKATWPLANSSFASSSFTTNLPSPWLTAMVCRSPILKLESQGELTVETLVVTICETWRLISFLNNVGESFVTIPRRPYGRRPDLTSAWKPLQIPRISPPLSRSLCISSAISLLFSTLAMNLPLPSGSSPAENPPHRASIWHSDMFFFISAMERKISSLLRLQKVVILTSAPALRKALAVS